MLTSKKLAMGNEKREKIMSNKVSKGCQAAEEEEEEKMEQFYSLIRSFRDARDHRRNELKQMEIINNNNKQQNQINILKKRKLAADQQKTAGSSSSFVPSFRMEDFTQKEAELIKRTPLLKFPGPAAPSCFNKKNHQPPNDDTNKDEDSGLNLKLSL